MQSFGMALYLKNDPQAIEKYKSHHQKVWPEVETALKSVGITTMKIFLIGRKLFMYMETVDDFKPERTDGKQPVEVRRAKRRRSKKSD